MLTLYFAPNEMSQSTFLKQKENICLPLHSLAKQWGAVCGCVNNMPILLKHICFQDKNDQIVSTFCENFVNKFKMKSNLISIPLLVLNILSLQISQEFNSQCLAAALLQPLSCASSMCSFHLMLLLKP